MTLEQLHGKNICILGYGKEGHAAHAMLKTHCPTVTITIADANPQLYTKDCECVSGDDYMTNLDRFDVIIKSPGIPPCKELDAVREKLTNGTEIFLRTALQKKAFVIGITGSKGKSTTSSLLYAILSSRWDNTLLVGNIGEPALAHIDELGQDVKVVMEMSSYQLMECTVSPHIAILTSFFPEHLNYHGSLENYKQAKMRITMFQKEDDVLLYASGYPDLEDMARASKAQAHKIERSAAPVSIEETRLIGEHNLENIALAAQAARLAGADETHIVESCKSFDGLPHRLQSLGTHHGIHWVDDAISTTPESAIAAIKALKNSVDCIILGGEDRGISFDVLGEFIAESSVQTVILFPDTGAKIRAAIETAGGRQKFFDADSMKNAVETAKSQLNSGGTCLLSTASPSYNMFKNFEEKGNMFAACITGE